MNILVLGVTGMLGHSVFDYLRQYSAHHVSGTSRSSSTHPDIFGGVDVLDQDALVNVFSVASPDVVINCVGLIKQLADSNNPFVALPINALLPHRLTALCELVGARLVHISTDCVFSGRQGGYRESDVSDCEDLYGKSKYIGEVANKPHVVTLRTSIIGHELKSCSSLIDWFLSQEGEVKGFTRAVFSGVPTAELARIILDYVIPHPDLSGLYHVSADPIDKCSLLQHVAKVYQKTIRIVEDGSFSIDRSLDSSRFRSVVNYQPPSWPALIRFMEAHR